MRRSLVLTDDAARHPFRASLPPHVCARRDEGPERMVPWRVQLGLRTGDWRSFATNYCACLVGVTAFIA